VRARVTCTTFLNLLNYQVTRFRLDTFGHPTEVRVETGYPTVAEAQQRADAIAHDGCSGKGCGSWREVKPQGEDDRGDRGGGSDARGFRT